MKVEEPLPDRPVGTQAISQNAPGGTEEPASPAAAASKTPKLALPCRLATTDCTNTSGRARPSPPLGASDFFGSAEWAEEPRPNPTRKIPGPVTPSQEVPDLGARTGVRRQESVRPMDLLGNLHDVWPVQEAIRNLGAPIDGGFHTGKSLENSRVVDLPVPFGRFEIFFGGTIFSGN